MPFADAPGPGISKSEKARLAGQAPDVATIDRGANQLTFSGQNVDFAVALAPTTLVEHFRTAGLSDATVVVPVGRRCT